MDRAAEEKKWQAQLQLRRDQMAAATGGSLLYPYKRSSYTPYQKRSYSGGGGSTMEWCSQKQPQYMKV